MLKMRTPASKPAASTAGRRHMTILLTTLLSCTIRNEAVTAACLQLYALRQDASQDVSSQLVDLWIRRTFNIMSCYTPACNYTSVQPALCMPRYDIEIGSHPCGELTIKQHQAQMHNQLRSLQGLLHRIYLHTHFSQPPRRGKILQRIKGPPVHPGR